MFYTSFSNADPTTRLYRENKRILDEAKAAKTRSEEIFQNKRLKLINEQSGYNGVILKLPYNKMELKTMVDESSHFSFPKTTSGEHYVYALRILSGGKDITRMPAEMIHMYALSGEKIRKYAWMVPVVVDEDTYIRLDGSNTSRFSNDLFKD